MTEKVRYQLAGHPHTGVVIVIEREPGVPERKRTPVDVGNHSTHIVLREAPDGLPIRIPHNRFS
ncbi:MAG: hypothetical protein WC880_04605 [Candidatus Paceibacterota bacterium]